MLMSITSVAGIWLIGNTTQKNNNNHLAHVKGIRIIDHQNIVQPIHCQALFIVYINVYPVCGQALNSYLNISTRGCKIFVGKKFIDVASSDTWHDVETTHWLC